MFFNCMTLCHKKQGGKDKRIKQNPKKIEEYSRETVLERLAERKKMNKLDILNHFYKVKQTKPGQWQALCPAHQDKKASLTITETEDRFLIHCHAGCNYEDVLTAAGLEKKDLYKETYTNAVWWQKNLLSRYDYIDETGTVVCSKLRYKDKDFRFGVFNGNDFDTKAVPKERPLYNLWDLLDHRDQAPGSPVYIVEGEKDVETLKARGLTAVTPGSCTSWTKDHAKYFDDLKVIILNDNDEKGRAMADNIVKDIKDRCKAFKIVTTSTRYKGDVTNYLVDENHTVADLIQLAEKEPWIVKGKKEIKPLQIIEASDLALKEMEPAKVYIDNVLIEGTTLLNAKAKGGKSWFALDMALSLVQGKRFLGYQTHKCNVLYLSLEDSYRRLKSRIETINGSAEVPKGLYLTTECKRIGDGLEEQLEQLIEQDKNIGLIIIDTYQKVNPPQQKQSSAYEHDYNYLGKLQRLSLDKKIAILIIHHTKKTISSFDDIFSSPLGSTALEGVVDSIMILNVKRGENEPAQLFLTGRDVNNLSLTLQFNRTNCRWQNLGDTQELNKERTLRDYQSNAAVEFIKECIVQGNGKYKAKLEEMRNDILKTKKVMVGADVKEFSKILNNFNDCFFQDGIKHYSRKTTVTINGKQYKGLYHFYEYI